MFATFIYAGVQLYQPQIIKDIMTILANSTLTRHQMSDKIQNDGILILVVSGIGIVFAIVSNSNGR
ncbi:hypothetical protein KF7HA_01380 [Lactococcus lactis]|nr:hypothetical protein [Lactococcus lactis]